MTKIDSDKEQECLDKYPSFSKHTGTQTTTLVKLNIQLNHNEDLWDHGNLFQILVVRATEGYS